MTATIHQPPPGAVPLLPLPGTRLPDLQDLLLTPERAAMFWAAVEEETAARLAGRP